MLNVPANGLFTHRRHILEQLTKLMLKKNHAKQISVRTLKAMVNRGMSEPFSGVLCLILYMQNHTNFLLV